MKAKGVYTQDGVTQERYEDRGPLRYAGADEDGWERVLRAAMRGDYIEGRRLA